jgi:hypothetical protein
MTILRKFQILKVSEKDIAATVIRTDIERFAELEERKAEQQALIEEERSGFNQTQAVNIPSEFKRVVYGSRRPPLPVEELGKLRDVAFQNFRTKLGSVLARRTEMPRVTLQGSHLVRNIIDCCLCYSYVIQLSAHRSHHSNL